MEDVLDLYAEPPDPARPVVCLDECPVRPARRRAPAAAAGRPARPRPARPPSTSGAAPACLAVAFDPHRGWRHVSASERRTKRDFAGWLKELVDDHYPHAETIRLVVDNLNTHTPAALYEAFPPAEAHRLARKLELHYTPKHGSWLNMVEIELSVLASQCLDRRIPDLADAGPGGRRLGRRAQRRPGHHRLALHDRRCAGQTRRALPLIITVVAY